jgi:hypothetical protein
MGKIIMAEKKDKYIEVIAKIIELTQKGKIKWQPLTTLTNSLKTLNSDIIDWAFKASYKDKNLRIFRRHYWTSSFGDIGRMLSPIGAEPKKVQRSMVVLQLTDSKDSLIWEFPSESITSDLLTAVQYQTSDVADFMNDILRE